MTTHIIPMTPSESLFVKVGRTKLPFQGAAHASRAYREAIERSGLGASQTPTCTIVDQSGVIIGRISYNGKVWLGSDADWQSSDTPVYSPYAS